MRFVVAPRYERCVLQVWAYDLIPDPKFPKSAPKRYVRATLDEFKQAYAKIAERDRHAYEVIDEKKPCFSYFDLEFSRGGGDERDGNAIARRIVDAAVSVIRRLCGSTEVEIDAIFLDSSRPNKFSQHVVLRSFVLPFGRRILAPLQGSEAAGKVARLTVDQLKDDFDKAAVDVLVYTKSRCFRIEGSSKLGSAIPLRIRSCLRYAKDSVVEVEPPKPGDLRRTLVVPELPPDHVHILRFKGDLMHRPSSLQSSTNQQENMVVPEQDKIMVQKTVENSPATIERGPLRENYSGISWLKCWNGATTTPLLDLIDVKHEFVCARQTGKKNPPQPFERLAEWAVDMARRRLRPIKPITIYAWRYVRAEFPPEQYLHLTIFGSRYCHSRGRHHRSNNVIVTVDPTTGATWQRCWDSADCCETAKTADGVTVRLYSKHFFVDERAPPEVLPRPLDLYSFEIGHGLYRRRRPEGDGDDKNEAETTREELSKKENGLIRQEAPPTSSAADLLEENVNAVAKATQAESSQVTTDVIHGALDLLANVSSRNGVHATHSPAVDNTALLNAETVTL